MKRIFLFLVAAALLFSLGSCQKADKHVTLVMAEVNPADTIVGQMDYIFKTKVEELSEGSITIDLHCAGILGDEKQVMNLMLHPHSTIQIYRASALSLVPYKCVKTAMFALPYVFENREHFWLFAETDTAQDMLNEPLEKGLSVRGLFYGEEGFRHFFSTKKITNVAEFEGLKLRITNDSVMRGVAQGIKATPVSVNFTDLYSALKMGEVDAAEQPIANYLSNHFYEVAPYMILDGHTLGVTETIITTEAWNVLSKTQQQALHDAGSYASKFCKELSQAEEERGRAELLMKGATLTAVPDKTAWQTACADIISTESAVAADVYAEIKALAK